MRLLIFVIILVSLPLLRTEASKPDSAYIFSYVTLKNGGRNGLHHAWSIDKRNWHSIGPEFRFLTCDFGSWGSQKRMLTPYLFQDQKGVWHAVWSLNETVGQFAHSQSTDLFTWDVQAYPEVTTQGNVMLPEVSFQPGKNNYLITWLSDRDGIVKINKKTTTDFREYSETEEGLESDRINTRTEVMIEGESQSGTISKVPWQTVDMLIRYSEQKKYQEIQRSERLTDDKTRYTGLKPPAMNIGFDPAGSKAISDMLIGVFFEDINYGADGGLYAELVQNRGFEYDPDEKRRDKTWNSKKAWSFTGNNSDFIIDTVAPVHPNQKHYAVLSVSEPGQALRNEGFEGIPLKAGEKYDFSVFTRGLNGYRGKLLVRLVDGDGKVIAEGSGKAVSDKWQRMELVLTANASADKALLEVIPQSRGKVALDMISLFPRETFKGRKNGLRADLAQTIADLHPRFIRFPGGCVAHGDGLHNIYNWKNTIGPLEARIPDRNIWGYHQSMGLGYFEYFQFCKDVGAEPLPVIAAGVPCQNSSTGGHGQQGGIPMCDMGNYVQDILDLIEWANGDRKSKWGKLRAEAGHPEPFNLRYICIGNEDLISDIFKERFEMIFNAVREKHPEITVIGTVGPFSEGADYREGWQFATELGVTMVDEHYYQSPGWFLNNQTYYDSYDRSKSKVYLGEYAAHIPGRALTMETALSEALHLINIERNADIVSFTSYAPLLGKRGFTQWNPDLIYFSNTEIFLTPDYHVQKIFGQNPGNKYIPNVTHVSDDRAEVRKRLAVSMIQDGKTGDYILKLANLLPVSVGAKIDFSFINGLSGEAELTLLSGEPEDEGAVPSASMIPVGDITDYTMPAYSFSVIRIRNK